ncbi:succinate dehydrogenase/fumarate reductase iron-sulfur subunit [bacterium BMS3Abin01]|nr:succinate dehydrogenase/fumarate reductase iron-sulfur subunit [bacterium BMS3Abin01]
MIPLSETLSQGRELVAEIEHRSGQKVADCYQCGTCSSTCAAADAFDYPPHMFMRLLQLGAVDRAMASTTGQLCYDCMTCSSRCPIRIDVADVIETTKNIADEQGIRESERGLRLFRNLFLKNVRRHGRLHEASLLAWFNLKSGKLTNDLSLVPLILRRKNVRIVQPRIKDRAQVRRIFQRAKERPRW